MSELGATLTTTGLIATVVAVFFGVAALYVSNRRRAQAAVDGATSPNPEPTKQIDRPDPAPKRAASTTPADDATPSRLPPVKPSNNTGPAVAEEVNPLWTRSVFSTGQTGSPLFERLGARKDPPRDPPVAPSPAGKGREYRWD